MPQSSCSLAGSAQTASEWIVDPCKQILPHGLDAIEDFQLQSIVPLRGPFIVKISPGWTANTAGLREKYDT